MKNNQKTYNVITNQRVIKVSDFDINDAVENSRHIFLKKSEKILNVVPDTIEISSERGKWFSIGVFTILIMLIVTYYILCAHFNL